MTYVSLSQIAEVSATWKQLLCCSPSLKTGVLWRTVTLPVSAFITLANHPTTIRFFLYWTIMQVTFPSDSAVTVKDNPVKVCIAYISWLASCACIPLVWHTPWGWHPGAETCRRFRSARNCILRSAFVTLCINNNALKCAYVLHYRLAISEVRRASRK